MNKESAYKSLVKKRKSCSLCDGLRNPAIIEKGKLDSNEIGPWSVWQGNLNSKIVVVGQDWGDTNYFKKFKGRDQPSNNPTNENLQKLLKIIGINIKKPCESQDHTIFLTNLILCLKKGGLQGPVEDDWFHNCCSFFVSLIEIIQPKLIIALGKKVTESILQSFSITFRKSDPYYKMLEKSPYQLSETLVLFPLYHCGAGGVNRNRPMQTQEKDWSKINIWLEKNGIKI